MICSQGLILKDQDTLVESAGLYRQSSIHFINRADMTVGKESKLDKEFFAEASKFDKGFFAEGCELVNINGESLIYQLTWRERKVYK